MLHTYTTLLNDILKNGVTVNGTLELMNQKLIVSSYCLYDFPGVREYKDTSRYMREEVAWYMSGDRRVELISPHAKLWDKIKNPDGTVNSNYGNLVFYGQAFSWSIAPFEWAARALEKDINSRQGMVTYNTGGFNLEGNKDYICTQHQAFYIRDGKLLCYVALRSSDAIFCLTYNMPWWQLVYQQMFLRLLKTYPNLRTEPIEVTIYSAHIYAQHIKLVQEMLLCREQNVYGFRLTKEIPLGNSYEWYRENLKWIDDEEVTHLDVA